MLWISVWNERGFVAGKLWSFGLLALADIDPISLGSWKIQHDAIG
jgi:hypothetical protein